MYDARCDILAPGVHRYLPTRNGSPIAFSEVLELWQRDAAFRDAFLALLTESPFTAYRWETPYLSRAGAGRDFQFVLLDSPWLAVPPDTHSFAPYLSVGDEDVVCFDNLGGDARLVVPTPRAADDIYPHLASFVRGAPAAQVHALWAIVGRATLETLAQRPLWLSTAGGGVAWLHVRLDQRPKYYGHAAYRGRE